MTRRRAPRDPRQRLADGNRAQRTAAAGIVYNAAPIPAQASAVAQALSSVADVTATADWEDEFVLTSDGAQTKTLTYLPNDKSELVFLNTEFQRRNVDWSRSGQTLSILSPMGALTDDILTVHYHYLTGQPAVLNDYDSNYATAVMADSPVAYYRLNEASGNALDFTGHGHHAAVTGSPTRQATGLLTTDSDTGWGISDNGRYFTIPYAAAFATSSWTFEWWTGKGNGSPAATVLDWPGRLKIVMNNDTAPESRHSVLFYTDATTTAVVDTSASGMTNGDHYYAITFDGTVLRYYNSTGLVDTSGTIGTSLRASTEDIKIGSIAGPFGYLPDLDEVAWYGTELSAAQLDNHWDQR